MLLAGSSAVSAVSFAVLPSAPPESNVHLRGATGPQEEQTRFSEGSGAAGMTFAAGCTLALGAVLPPARRQRARTSAAVSPKEQPGVTKPLGFWDPLALSEFPIMTFPNDPTGFRHLRAAEIKHGRVCMMASFGSVFAHYVKFPGFEKVPTGLAALNTDMGASGFAVLILLVGLFEACTWEGRDDEEPGSYGDPLNFGDGKFTLDMRNRELNNSRMAMFAMMGQIVAEMQTGLDPVQQFGLQ
jgi:hypothetical protein